MIGPIVAEAAEPADEAAEQPENASLEPIYAEHVQILGKVVGVFRTL